MDSAGARNFLARRAGLRWNVSTMFYRVKCRFDIRLTKRRQPVKKACEDSFEFPALADSRRLAGGNPREANSPPLVEHFPPAGRRLRYWAAAPGGPGGP